jgi:trans-aconitate methyltransferase
MLQVAWGAAPTSGNLRFEIGNVPTMAFDDEFDAVVSFNALHWAPDQLHALTRIRAALHATGWALLQFVDDVIGAYAGTTGSAQRFAFRQLRARLIVRPH